MNGAALSYKKLRNAFSGYKDMSFNVISSVFDFKVDH